ncbi:unnamed protein product [Clonostachys rosea f. rosea IK726]|uniref:Bifunctional lycopene cyclase/phytoene synthase n=2 Tax=Bionectria ochroleuca TaxID=29856 RepID=A0A0B7JVF1_BIOOC|nr:unnamed protein product [Clonostachys rosea f. rosea IK726]
MFFDYALVHVKFTIPLAGLLTVIAKPFLTYLDATRILFLVTVAVTATIPWDSYLIRTGVWTYPEDGVLGQSLFSIPVEELFFFVIQTYITSLVYILCNKPVLLAQYLTTREARPEWIRQGKAFGQFLFVALAAFGGFLVIQNDQRTYLGLILAWACPVLWMTWSLSGDMILALPWTSTVLPIMAPTIYLWFVDELSLRQGIWTIEDDTKLGSQLFGKLDLEEAIFFLISNMLVVFGLLAFDKATAVHDAFPELFPQPSSSVPMMSLLRARAVPSAHYDMQRIVGIQESVARLQKKSRSFHIASSVFPGRVRIDLTLLYSYCRLADDLIDNAETPEEALDWISKLKGHLDSVYCAPKAANVGHFIRANFPPSAHSALNLLPTHVISSEPLYELLEGFRTDVEFSMSDRPPIQEEEHLELYASRVASTIGELCLDVIFHHTLQKVENKRALYSAAKEMGIALQYVNIARDVVVDAKIGRVYLPVSWLEEEGMTTEMVLEKPSGPQIDVMRRRLLGKAFQRYRNSRPAMDMIPKEGRGPMIVAVESYMEIGRVLAEGGLRVEGKATVPAWRRIGVVWKTALRNS